ncbi:MAG: hypothetical protein K2Z81_13355, partial [Cyanobacteria bacterium]|nr:hypothetical protein [Cyanobacteriota bacterium]
TPTLENLFTRTGALYLAKRGPAEIQPDIEKFHREMGIRRLRDAFKVIPKAAPGGDRSEERAQAIQALRTTLKALLAVIPRVEVERPLEPNNTWVYAERLRSLAASGSIKVVDKLSVRFVLEGVGETSVERPAAYDHERGELLIDIRVLDYPELTGLAEGVLPAIINGPQAETFVDLLEILIARRERLRMEAYLNQRHFAGASSVHLDFTDIIAGRIGDFLDYGLADKLVSAFPQIKGSDFNSWRDRGLIERLREAGKSDFGELSGLAAELLIEKLQLKDPAPELQNVLKNVLMASSVSDAYDCLIPQKTGADKILEVVRTTDKHGDEDRSPDNSVDAPHASGDSSNRSVLDNLLMFGDRASRTKHSAGDPDGSGLVDSESKKAVGFWSRLFGIDSGEKREEEPVPLRRKESFADEPEYDPANEKPQLPGWIRGNYFRPKSNIQQQLWCTPDNLGQLETSHKPVWLSMSPSKLPSPHVYAIQKIGSNFDPVTQCWRFTSDTEKIFRTPGTPSGQIVSFSGMLYSGESRLPMPLYSRLKGKLRVPDGMRYSVSEDAFGVTVDLGSSDDELVPVSFDVEILRVPTFLSDSTPALLPDKSFLKPTTALDSLPPRVREWLDVLGKSGLPQWKLALAAQDFVRTNYQYHDRFMEMPEVRARRSKLKFFRGNHHLELLHASANDKYLGHGICYELNVMVVELLRHLRVPACVAVGWVLDEGVVSIPLHLFALALVPSDNGVCVMPVDGAASENGPILSVRRGNMGPSMPPSDLVRRPEIPSVGGGWNISAITSGRKQRPHLSGTREAAERRNESSTDHFGGSVAAKRTSPSSSSSTPLIFGPGDREKKSEQPGKNSPWDRFVKEFMNLAKPLNQEQSRPSGDDADSRVREAEFKQQQAERSLQEAQEQKERTEAKLERERRQRQRAVNEAAEARRGQKFAEGRLQDEEKRYKDTAAMLEIERALRAAAEGKLGRREQSSQDSDSELQEYENVDDDVFVAGAAEQTPGEHHRFVVKSTAADEATSELIGEALQRVSTAMGLENRSNPKSDVETLRRLTQLLGSTALLRAYLRILQRKCIETEAVSDDVHKLAALGLVSIEMVPTIRVTPT